MFMIATTEEAEAQDTFTQHRTWIALPLGGIGDGMKTAELPCQISSGFATKKPLKSPFQHQFYAKNIRQCSM
jgi:hypothetical protein